MNYQEARLYLDELSKYGSVLGLESMRELLKRLGTRRIASRAREVALDAWHDVPGSKLRPWDSFHILLDLIRIARLPNIQ